MDCGNFIVFGCLCGIIVFVGIGFMFESLKGFLITWGIATLLAIFVFSYLIINHDEMEQCRIQKEQVRIENDKQKLLFHLDKGQCGDVCIKESNSKHSNRYHHYTMCEVSVRVCK